MKHFSVATITIFALLLVSSSALALTPSLGAGSGSGGSGTPSGNDNDVQYGVSGAFAAEDAFEYDPATNTLDVENLQADSATFGDSPGINGLLARSNDGGTDHSCGSQNANDIIFISDDSSGSDGFDDEPYVCLDDGGKYSLRASPTISVTGASVTITSIQAREVWLFMNDDTGTLTNNVQTINLPALSTVPFGSRTCAYDNDTTNGFEWHPSGTDVMILSQGTILDGGDRIRSDSAFTVGRRSCIMKANREGLTPTSAWVVVDNTGNFSDAGP